MNLLSVENLSKSYGETLLFDQISFGIEKGQKTALIARNGTGKSTLLNILVGKDIPDEGSVTFRKDSQIAYLPQDNDFGFEGSVLDTIFDSNTPFISAVRNYEYALNRYQSLSSDESRVALENSMEAMELQHAWNYENQVKEILHRFGIRDMFAPWSSLSGGEKKKVALSKVLLSEADLWILDEPTNHLDIQMIEWLEEFLTDAGKSLLLVTHDRFFLDNVCDDILEIDNTKLYKYKGKYSYFLEKKAERIAAQAAEQERYRNLYRQELVWMRASVQARGTKAKARKDHFEELKEKAFAPVSKEEAGFSVQAERVGKKILEISNLDFSYPSKVILKDFSYIFKRNERCGVVGPNGCGKSTFLKLIVGELQAQAGKIDVGETIVFGYYSQSGLPATNQGKRVIDIVREQGDMVRMADGHIWSASHFLNHFGFTYDIQYTYYEDLSGGQKRKLYLLLVLMKNPNFLILDEPTNDFDIDTMNLLEDFLLHFQGCLLVVSHDRWFMDKLMEHLFVFQGEGKIKDFYGNYSDWHQHQKQLERGQMLKARSEKPVQAKLPRMEAKKKLTYREEREFAALNEEIAALESEKEALNQLFAHPEGDTEQLKAAAERYRLLQLELDEKTMRWFELSEKTL